MIKACQISLTGVYIDYFSTLTLNSEMLTLTSILIPDTSNSPLIDVMLYDADLKCLYLIQITVISTANSHHTTLKNCVGNSTSRSYNFLLKLAQSFDQLPTVYLIYITSGKCSTNAVEGYNEINFKSMEEEFIALKSLTFKT